MTSDNGYLCHDCEFMIAGDHVYFLWRKDIFGEICLGVFPKAMACITRRSYLFSCICALRGVTLNSLEWQLCGLWSYQMFQLNQINCTWIWKTCITLIRILLSFCLFAFLPFCLFVFLSFCLFVFFVFLSFCLFVFLSLPQTLETLLTFDHIVFWFFPNIYQRKKETGIERWLSNKVWQLQFIFASLPPWKTFLRTKCSM